ncbi:MAG: phage virion morphogenesis protein [Acetobacter sp.]|jgi:phage virion morphogenesis protein|nr:phage virion morphogenesis protein [Acetobacter sp.]MCH4060548.1 phage virion morphogenesis protein [Acetobacter sp.]MCH4087488.1 phage virion morphogenesis protein [Acetobacter sp.]MCI1294689.1 phage virion morphogenesis protein [Acetobacter sp.]MCI1321162.1 phage virion morphogenesis protein [Acetobacter sp.]
MTGVTMKLSGSLVPIQDSLKRIETIGTDPSAVLAGIGPAIVRNTQRRMQAGKDPKGVLWSSYAPLNPLYAEDKEGSDILINDGMNGGLMGSLTSRVLGSRLLWGTNKIYGAIHQFGGVIRAKNAKSLEFHMGGKRFRIAAVTIPARPYLGFTDEDRLVVIEGLEDFLSHAMRGS